MPKSYSSTRISTADCYVAIQEAIQNSYLDEFFDTQSRWKKVTSFIRTTSAKTRLFVCKECPILFANVVEASKIIKSVTFFVMPPWQAELEKMNKKESIIWYENEVLSSFIQCNPEDFYYETFEKPGISGVYIKFTPKLYFDNTGDHYQGDITNFISEIPYSSSIASVIELNYDTIIIEDKSFEKVNEELQMLGYTKNQSFTEYVTRG